MKNNKVFHFERLKIKRFIASSILYIGFVVAIRLGGIIGGGLYLPLLIYVERKIGK